jgi:hypothetical protein
VRGGSVLAPNSCHKEAHLVGSGSVVTPETVALKLVWDVQGTKCLMIIHPIPVAAYEEPFHGGKTTVLIELPDNTKISLPIQIVT